MSDHAKRLAEIEALIAGVPGGVWSWEEHSGSRWTLYVNRGEPIDPDWPAGICNRQHGLNILRGDEGTFDGNGANLRAFIVGAREALSWLLAERRAASDALTAAGITDDGRTLAERVKALAAVAGRAERARRTAIASHNVGAPFNPDALFGQELRVYPAPATVADRCDACGRASLLGLDHDYHPEPDIEPAEPPVDRAALVGLPSTAETTADPWLDEPLTSEEQAAIAAAEATPGAGEPW